MAYNITVVTGTGSASYTIATSARGPAGPAGAAGASAWGDITGKPSTFAPVIGAGAADAVAGNDARLHARQHSVTGGSDHTFPGGTSDFLRADGTFAAPPGGTLTNAAVNAVLDDDAPASRAAIEVSQNNKHLRGLGNLVTTAATSQDFPVSVITIGDSYAAFADFKSLQRGAKIAGSYRCGAATGGGDTGVTNVTGDTRSPDGVLRTVASGGILSAGHLDSAVAGPADRAYFTFFTGAGTVQFQYSDNGGAWTNFGSAINTAAISTVSVGSVALPSCMSQARTRIVVTVGSVSGWIGQGVDGPGITQINFATSGQGIEQIACGETIWKAMIAGYRPATGGQLVYCIYADFRFTSVSTTPWPTKGTPSWDSSGPAQTLYNWSRAQNATVDWMVVGPHTVNPANNDTSDALIDAAFAGIGIGLNTNDRIRDGAKAQREFAVRNSLGFVDCVDIFPDYTRANAEGFYGDSVHLSAKGDSVKRSFVLTNSNMGWLFGNEGYRSSIRLGRALLQADMERNHRPSIVATSEGGTDLVGFVGDTFRAGLSTRFQTEGSAFWTPSSNIMHLGLYGTSSKTGYLAIDSNGSYPVSTAGTYTSGIMANPWGCVNTNGLRTGYVIKTADYTIARNTSTDYLIHYTTGPFTVTLPLAFSGEKTGISGRTYIIKNSSASNITVATLSDGTNLQKIDAATTATVAPGATLRVMSAQVSGFASADHGNWITF